MEAPGPEFPILISDDRDADKSRQNPESVMCSVCRELEGLNCSNCHKVRYCSTEHQREDWKRHKPDCFPAKVTHDAVRGRYLVATRMIPEGEVFLKEKPLLVGPSTSGRALIVCLSCCRRIQPTRICSKCSWPVCDQICEQAAQHAKFECGVYAQAGLRPSHRPDMDMENLKVMRGLLLKRTYPEKWDRLLQLESHTERRGADPDIAINTNSAVDHVRNQCGLEEFDVETIQRVDGAINVNAMASGDGDGPNLIPPRYGAYVYLHGSMANHSCTPNIRRIIQLDSTLNFQATVPILPGDTIVTSYCYVLHGTLKRRAQLEKYYFSCNCPRCADPTELGTHLSSVTCQRCFKKSSTGYLLPIDSLNADSDWKCDTCGLARTADDIRSFVGTIETEIDAVTVDVTVASLQRLEALVKKHLGTSLHPDHYLIISAKQDIAQQIVHLLQDGAVPMDSDTAGLMAKRQVDLCRRLLTLASTLWPGCCEFRGRLLHTLYSGIILYVSQKVGKETASPIGREKKLELNALLDEAIECREEGSKILSQSPSTRQQIEFERVSGQAAQIESLKQRLGN